MFNPSLKETSTRRRWSLARVQKDQGTGIVAMEVAGGVVGG